ncbi:right-handed parallel beta-helix repeat-containing protein [Sphingomonas arantia]|uniref:Right-handed parallel beta-helix repeat-containing protein n=1 Tax=Sphingomonas arantia TaxID=1460676 RepID=A0ABW4TVL4_9SPHN
MDDGVVCQAAGKGIAVNGEAGVTIRRTIVAETGERGVILGGGARVSLTPARHAFVDGLVSDFGLLSPSYRPAIDVWGVANTVSGSVIQRGDHAGILLSGNDHVVADNEIRQVLRDTEDAGAVYMGADWSQRGNRITGNYIHDLGTPGRKTTFLNGVYLDDQGSGTQVTGNMVVGGEFGVTIGGGRDNRVAGNVFAFQTRGGLSFDARWMDKQRAVMPAFVRKMRAMPTTTEPWRSHYPALTALDPARYGVPDGNVVTGNRVIGATRPTCAVPRIIAGPQPVLHFLKLDANVALCAAPGRVAGFDTVRRKRVAALQDRLAALSGQD